MSRFPFLLLLLRPRVVVTERRRRRVCSNNFQGLKTFFQLFFFFFPPRFLGNFYREDQVKWARTFSSSFFGSWELVGHTHVKESVCVFFPHHVRSLKKPILNPTLLSCLLRPTTKKTTPKRQQQQPEHQLQRPRSSSSPFLV